MSESKKLYILGYSGHAYVVIDVAESNAYKIKGYFAGEKARTNPYDLNYVGDENKVDIRQIVEDDYMFPAIGENNIRQKVVTVIQEAKIKQLVLVDKSATLSSKTSVGNSTLIGPKVVVNSLTTIGIGCIINTAAVVEHECKIGNFSHIAPGAVLAGNVIVGTNTFIGANAVVKQGITIGNNVIVGAGAVVLKNISDNEVWVGNPASRIYE